LKNTADPTASGWRNQSSKHPDPIAEVAPLGIRSPYRHGEFARDLQQTVERETSSDIGPWHRRRCRGCATVTTWARRALSLATTTLAALWIGGLSALLLQHVLTTPLVWRPPLPQLARPRHGAPARRARQSRQC
jgi:hypothetical protein